MNPKNMAMSMMHEYESKLELVSSDLPEIKDKKVGDKMKIELEVVMTEAEMIGDKEIEACFEIKKAKLL